MARSLYRRHVLPPSVYFSISLYNHSEIRAFLEYSGCGVGDLGRHHAKSASRHPIALSRLSPGRPKLYSATYLAHRDKKQDLQFSDVHMG